MNGFVPCLAKWLIRCIFTFILHYERFFCQELILKILCFLSFLGLVAGRIIFAMIGKFSVMNSFDAIFVFSAELFPTVVR